MKPQNTSELSKLVQEGKKKSLHKTSLILDKFFHLKKKNELNLPCVSTTYMLFWQAGGKKSSQAQAHNPNGVYFRNALLIQAQKKKKNFWGKMLVPKKIANRMMSVLLHANN